MAKPHTQHVTPMSSQQPTPQKDDRPLGKAATLGTACRRFAQICIETSITGYVRDTCNFRSQRWVSRKEHFFGQAIHSA
jgi:hypothetical protein